MAALFIRIALLVIVAVHIDQGHAVPAVAAQLYQDCLFSWSANTESDLAGYRLYMGRLASQLSQVSDIGLRTTVRCSEVGAKANGRWFGAVTAYDKSGNESAPSQVLPFELTGIAEPTPPSQIAEPTLVNLTVRVPGFQLLWYDRNLPRVFSRVEMSSSLKPEWMTVTLLPPGSTRFSYFQPGEAEWVCYRVRGESGALVSNWAQAGGPNDRQFCFRPARVSVIEQPIVASTVLYEPLSVRLVPAQPGFELTWVGAGASANVSYRIEVSSSVNSNWSTLAVLPSTVTKFTHGLPIDADWVCARVRAEVGRFVSLWAMAGDPTDRQFCFRPGL